jgi:hypothetical protein
LCNGTALGNCALSPLAWLDLYGRDSGVARDASLCSFNLSSAADLTRLSDVAEQLEYTDVQPGLYVLASWEQADHETVRGFYYQVGLPSLPPDVAWAAARSAKKPLVIMSARELLFGRPPFRAMPTTWLPM